ncbi:hypothetical protein ACFWD7_45240 [Streptomyces mirabilis]|uniref:hypothetical protein n=1 Tax=Streptomyces mirabilis TaxID=68239 RepID=UPI0021C1B937|nr:hypothetical protein [Streptomyces mirabilis]MCT9104749.1 hypothetical protein [Streptomyces mirabilis]
MTSRIRRMLPVAGAAVILALAGTPMLASADPQPTGGPTGDTPPSAVEDYAYPNADQIQQEAGIKLIKGDGHITLATCDDSGRQIKVLTVQGPSGNPQSAYCFKASAKSGYLSLELPRVFALETTDHPISADLRPQADPSAPAKTVTVGKNGYQSVGEGAAGGAPAVLLELRVTG